jgi:ankyrin repeat protein
MTPNPEHQRFRKIDAAFRAGDLAALRAAVEDPEVVPNGAGSPARPDVLDIIKLLLTFGADPNQRGINDYTPLHMAVREQNLPAVRLLLEAGADPALRTRIDDYETPREMAVDAGLSEIAEVLKVSGEK